MNEQQRVEEQEVRDLIAGAGPRPVPPAEEVAAIQAAARREWRAMVERQRRRRSLRLRGGLALAASALLVLVLGWWWTTGPAPVAAPVVASIELVAGTVSAGDAPLARGGELVAGALIETAAWGEGSPAGAALRLAGGQSLRLGAGTRLRLASERRFELERGTVYVDADASAAPSGVEVVTALGTVRDVGTQFEVRLSDSQTALRVRVREGECDLEAGAAHHRVTRGEQLSLLDDGTLLHAEVAPYGAEWDWVVATAPVIEMDGRSLAEVLAWVERETGRRVRYAEPVLQSAAEAGVVSGSSAGFTLEQTLHWAARTSGVAYQVENGSILITARQAQR